MQSSSRYMEAISMKQCTCTRNTRCCSTGQNVAEGVRKWLKPDQCMHLNNGLFHYRNFFYFTQLLLPWHQLQTSDQVWFAQERCKCASTSKSIPSMIAILLPKPHKSRKLMPVGLQVLQQADVLMTNNFCVQPPQ